MNESGANERITDMRGIHLGSYWMGENDVVCLMAHDLADLCDLEIVDTGIYDPTPSPWFSEDFAHDAKTPIRWLDEDRVVELIERVRPDFVVVNAGGMAISETLAHVFRERRIVTVGLALSDPDWFDCHGRHTHHRFDRFYTNSLYSLENSYPAKETTKLLPFAASSRLHRPLPEVDKEFDLVVVGHARPERRRLVQFLRRRFHVGVFGDGWDEGLGAVHGEQHVHAINSGRAYLSFSGTVAGFTNVKVGLFEAAACRTLLLTEFFPEMERYFRYGLEVVGYRRREELVDALSWYLRNDSLRDWMAENSYRRFLDDHTWHARWRGVLNDIEQSRLG